MKTVNFLLSLVLLVTVFSCEEEEDTNLNDQNQEIVEEGTFIVNGMSYTADKGYFASEEDEIRLILTGSEYESTEQDYDNKELSMVLLYLQGETLEGEFTGNLIESGEVVYFENGVGNEIELEGEENLTDNSSVSITKNGDSYNITYFLESTDGQPSIRGSFEGTLTDLCDDYSQSGSSLDLSNACDLFDNIWGPGSNSITIGGGLNYSTEPGIGWSQEFGGKYVTSFSIVGEDSDFITTTSEKSVIVEGPENSIIEVWDLETMKVISTNISNPGTSTSFTALPNHRYGGFAWYADNAQKDIAINASSN